MGIGPEVGEAVRAAPGVVPVEVVVPCTGRRGPGFVEWLGRVVLVVIMVRVVAG